MQQLPSTFCPAKWDEISFHFAYDYVNSCCKATPIKFDNGDYSKVINEQKLNLLNGIQDPSCDYCWKVENKNLPSRRLEYLENFDLEKFELYKKNKITPTRVDLYIGNECNFQCTYCNPKYSSNWELDVKNKPYKVFTDRHFYAVDTKKVKITDQILNLVGNFSKDISLVILGGEPLHNKIFWKILDICTVDNFYFSTNLSCETKKLDQLIEKATKFKNFHITISIDSTGANAEFTRHGLNFSLLEKNLDYLIENSLSNTKILINSVISSITVHDLQNLLEFIKLKKLRYKDLACTVSPCVQPRIQSFDTLHDKYKDQILEIINEMKSLDYIMGTSMLESSLLSSKFNNTLYQELKQFLNEFSNRKNIKVPICLD